MTINLRFDSLTPSAGAFFEQDLLYVRQEVLKDDRPPLNGFELIPQDTSVPAAVNQYEHRMYEAIGVAQWISDYSQARPNVDISARAEIFNARTFGNSYQYSLAEIEQSAYLKYNLDRKRADAAKEIIEEMFNRIMFYGDASQQLFGWVNYPYIPRRVVSFPFDASSSTVNILAELNAAINQPYLQTRTSAQADTLVMAPELMTFLEATPWSTSTNGATDRTIMEQFKATNSRIKEVKAAQELSFAGPDGEHLMIAYRKDPRVFSHKLIKPFTQLAPFQMYQAIITDCEGKSGGIACDRPLEMVIVEVPIS